MNILKRLFVLIFVFCNLLLANEKLLTIVSSEDTKNNLKAESLVKKHIKDNSLNMRVQSRAIEVSSNELSSKNRLDKVLQSDQKNASNYEVNNLDSKDIENSDYIITISQDHKDAVLKTYPNSKGKVFTLPEFAKDKNENLGDLYEESNQYDQNIENQINEYLPFALDKVNQMDN